MGRSRWVGLRRLMAGARLDGPPRPYHLGFLLGPRINAGGRIGDPGLGCQLLLSDDETEAAEIAAALERLNRERQSIESAMVDEAVAAAEAMARSDAGVIVTASPPSHPR